MNNPRVPPLPVVEGLPDRQHSASLQPFLRCRREPPRAFFLVLLWIGEPSAFGCISRPNEKVRLRLLGLVLRLNSRLSIVPACAAPSPSPIRERRRSKCARSIGSQHIIPPHKRASMLQRNFLLGHVHVYPASAREPQRRKSCRAGSLDIQPQ